MSARQKLANITRSKLGGFIIYGTALAMPAAAGMAIYDNAVPELDQSTNAQSQNAVSEYLSENTKLLNKYEKINALYASSKIQQGADNVLSVKQRQQDLEASLRIDAEDFSIRILNDKRLTESDYDLIEDKANLDRTSYMPLNLPNVANALFECRIETTKNDNKLIQSEGIRDCMMSNGSKENFVTVVSSIGMILLYIGMLVAIPENGKKLREKLAKRIERKPTKNH